MTRMLSHPSLAVLVNGQHSELEELLLQQITLARTVPPPTVQYWFALDQQPPRNWRFDLAWPEARVAVEVQGGTYVQGRHSRGAGQDRDAEKFSHAAGLGWRVLIVTKRYIVSGEALVWIERALAWRPSCPTT